MDRISLLSITYRIFASVPLLTLTVHKDKIIDDDQCRKLKARCITRNIYGPPDRSCNPAKEEDWSLNVV